MAGPVKRRNKGGRATQRATPRSPKALEITRLVEALSGDIGAHDGVHLGKGIARLLADAYRRRGTVPPWVAQLVVHYRGPNHDS